MSEPESINFFWLIGGLVLAMSALAARRESFGGILRALVAWGIIGAVAWYVVVNRDTIEAQVRAVGERFGVGGQTVEGATTRIVMAEDGHFWADVMVNGIRRRMLVDSGATVTALSPETAKAAGIDIEESTFPMVVQTANGAVAARHGTAAKVSVGSIRTTDLGVVVAPGFGADVLGMNFLSRLGSWRVEKRTLVLEPDEATQKDAGNERGAR